MKVALDAWSAGSLPPAEEGNEEGINLRIPALLAHRTEKLEGRDNRSLRPGTERDDFNSLSLQSRGTSCRSAYGLTILCGPWAPLVSLARFSPPRDLVSSGSSAYPAAGPNWTVRGQPSWLGKLEGVDLVVVVLDPGMAGRIRVQCAAQ